DIVEPVARVIVEWGYDRTIPPWEPTPFRLVPNIDPVTATADFVNAVGQGIGNAFRAIGVTLSPQNRSNFAAATSNTQPQSATTATSVGSLMSSPPLSEEATESSATRATAVNASASSTPPPESAQLV